MKQKSEKLKIKKIKKITEGRGCLCIYSGFNNTSITITRENGDKLTQPISARTATGYKGAKKVTSYAVQIAAKAALVKLNEFGISSIIIKTRGVGSGWSAAIKKIGEADNLRIEKIEAKNTLPFNGCRPRKAPRK